MEQQLSVKLIRYTPEPEHLIAAAAKLCYSRTGIGEIAEGLSGEEIARFVRMLVDMGHESPIEHVSFTFAVEGVSRVLTHQLVRHRIGCSYSQQSQRYVRLEQFDYIIPPAIAADAAAKAVFVQAMAEDQRHYNELVDILYKKHYDRLLAEGLSAKAAQKAAEKMAIEDARYVFPNACETKIVFTMSARALYNFFAQRCCRRAQWEIRALATEMLRQVKAVAPILFEKCGPDCVRGDCPEGKMSCGHAAAVREYFNNL